MRGLKQVKGKTGTTAGAGTLYGNLTNFGTTYGINVEVTGDLMIAGNHFHPGELNILWDNSISLGLVNANGTGWFNTTVTIPITGIGSHNVTIDDGKCIFVFYVNVIPTLILTPNEGVPCTDLDVTATGYGFPASTSSVIYVVEFFWWYTDWCSPANVTLGNVTTGSNGQFSFTFRLPHAPGGERTVYAVTNSSPTTEGDATFTVLPGMKITPSSFPNNGTMVTISGCGLDPEEYYDLMIDVQKDIYVESDCIGDFEVVLIAAGFDATLENHAAVLYQAPDEGEFNMQYLTHVLFQVTAPPTPVMDKLEEILAALADLDVKVVGIDGNVLTLVDDMGTIMDATVSIEGDIATIKLDLSTIKIDLAAAAAAAAGAQTQATNAASAAAGAQSAAEAVQTDTEGTKAAVSSISTAVYGAIVLSLIAALASIVAVITLQKKVA
jgi:hypothetical protein